MGDISNHGWSTITRVKTADKRKQKGEASISAGSKVTTGVSSVFSALEESSEARRSRIVAAKQAAADADRNFSDEEDEDKFGEEAERKANGAVAEAEEKKEKPKKIKKPKFTVADAAGAMNPSDLSAFLAEISESFAELPDVRLMRCADYFAKAFNRVTTAHFSLQKILKDSSPQKAAEVPLSDVPDAIITTASDWLATQPPEAIGTFLLLLLNEIMDAFHVLGGGQKGSGGGGGGVSSKTKVGLLVVLAILLRKQPQVMADHAEKLHTLPDLKSQTKLPLLVWACGQVASVDLILGMWLWVRTLLPLAVVPKTNPLARDMALTFIESVICKNLTKARSTLINGASKKGERVVPPAALEAVLRAAFPPHAARTKATERFSAVYPLVKAVALAGSSQTKSTKPAALQLLPLSLKAAGEDPIELAEEGCSLFLWCLSHNPDCYKQWAKHHMEQLEGSTKVLGYLVREWKSRSGQLAPMEDLRKCIRTLRRKHKESMKSSDRDSNKLVKEADALCIALLRKASSSSVYVRSGGVVVVTIAMVYGFYHLNPTNNPWGWDGGLILSQTHPPEEWYSRIVSLFRAD